MNIQIKHQIIMKRHIYIYIYLVCLLRKHWVDGVFVNPVHRS